MSAGDVEHAFEDLDEFESGGLASAKPHTPGANLAKLCEQEVPFNLVTWSGHVEIAWRGFKENGNVLQLCRRRIVVERSDENAQGAVARCRFSLEFTCGKVAQISAKALPLSRASYRVAAYLGQVDESAEAQGQTVVVILGARHAASFVSQVQDEGERLPSASGG
ncbi:hypothetical protein [Pseudonocardia sp. ICBG601]|uniref:hypothetical protein n=1 Tax=Pseudonocardia sp. ICBG601 TaxID=2846759 RepID=UPI001CF61CA0|nr:hypothetical protein [Pseudonocardia sp. ICBG601]